MKKTGIFLDLDGTLLNSEQKILNFDRKVLNKIKKENNIYLITGKSKINALQYYEHLNLKTKFVTSMGNVISDPSDINFKDIINFIDCKKIYDAYESLKNIVDVENYLLESIEGKCFVKNKDTNSNLLKLIWNDNYELIIDKKTKTKNIIGVYFEIKKISKNKLIRRMRKLNKIYKNVFSFNFWDTKNSLPIIQITSFNHSKEKAIKKIKEIDNLGRTIAFGDGWSDRNMLAFVDIGIAVKGSKKSVIKKATYESKFTNDEFVVGKELINILDLKIK